MLSLLKRTALILLIVPLAACFGVELDFEFHEDETIEVTTFMSFNKDTFEMMGASADGGVCDGAETMESETEITCVSSGKLTLSQAIANGLTAGDENSGQGMKATVRRINDTVIAVSMPIEVADNPATGDGDAEMEAAFKESFAGQDFKIWVTGVKILASNGTITEDERSTLMSFPMVDLITAADTVPTSFEVVLQYR